MTTLDEYLRMLGALSEADKRAVIEATKHDKWIPNPGPQTDAYFSAADMLLYGGAGGGGKSSLLAGLALTQHQRTLILRVQYTDLDAIIDEVCKVAGTRSGLNLSAPPKFKAADGRIVDFGAASNLDRAQTWQGNPHDLIGFDEACQFPEAVVRFLLGWNRAADESLDKRSRQRVRSILASNPPLAAEGEWVIGMFRPWLDVTHSNPAKPGELRWFVTDPDGHDLEVDGPEDARVWNGQTYTPASRTFIPAALNDNPFLIETGYQTTLDAMPEPMRSAIRDGNFLAAREDDPWQVIPTHWVLAAFERWREGRPENNAMTAVGLDVARGGRDATVLAPRFGKWFAELVLVPGRQTPDGPSVAALVAGILRDGAPVAVDSIGVGGAVEDALANAGLAYESINGSSRSTKATRDGSFHFVTKRSELWWSLREALDPDYGLDLALPPDVGLQADLTAPRYTVRPGDPPKIYVEAKEDIIKRLGRSPDRGDAVVYAYASGEIEKRRDRRERVKNAPTRANSGYSVRNWR